MPRPRVRQAAGQSRIAALCRESGAEALLPLLGQLAAQRRVGLVDDRRGARSRRAQLRRRRKWRYGDACPWRGVLPPGVKSTRTYLAISGRNLAFFATIDNNSRLAAFLARQGFPSEGLRGHAQIKPQPWRSGLRRDPRGRRLAQASVRLTNRKPGPQEKGPGPGLRGLPRWSCAGLRRGQIPGARPRVRPTWCRSYSGGSPTCCRLHADGIRAASSTSAPADGGAWCC